MDRKVQMAWGLTIVLCLQGQILGPGSSKGQALGPRSSLWDGKRLTTVRCCDLATERLSVHSRFSPVGAVGSAFGCCGQKRDDDSQLSTSLLQAVDLSGRTLASREDEVEHRIVVLIFDKLHLQILRFPCPIHFPGEAAGV